MEVGLALKLAVGAGLVTVTVADVAFDPAGPVQVAVYVVVTVGETVTLPDFAFPVEKLVPVQEVALVELQVSFDVCPLTIVDGFALSETAGGA